MNSITLLRLPWRNLLTLLCCLCVTLQVGAQASSTRIKVIPEVQSFLPMKGTYTLPTSVKILVNKGTTEQTDSLTKIAQQLQQELQAAYHTTAQIQTTDRTQAQTGEILLTYSKTPLANYEAYRMNIQDGITINGVTRVGIFWGTRTLLQVITNHENVVPRGNIFDYPNFPSRGFMLDVGRKFFTMDYLRQYVKLMSYYKMSEFHIHLNDNGFKQYYGGDWDKTYAAFRIKTDTYPGLEAKDGYYTKEEFRDLQLLGMQYGVNVIPEVDIPAHSLAFTRYEPKLKAEKPYGADHVELMDPARRPFVYNFFEKLFDELITGPNPAFIGPDVFVGTDEYAKEGNIGSVDNEQSKQFRLFTDHFLKYIADKGKRPRLWGGLKWLKDNPTTPVHPYGNAIMASWSTDWVDASLMIEDGFKIINMLDTWLYIVPRAGYYKDFLDTRWIYQNFRPEQISGSKKLPDLTPGITGSAFAVWNDICGNGISMQDVHYRSYPALQVMATKNWKVKPNRSYDDFEALAATVGEGPDLNVIGVYTAQQLSAITDKIGAEPITLDGKQSISLGGTDVGYDYTISFDLSPAADNAVNAILFQSSFSQLTLNTDGSGKLGFHRDGYTYTFNYTPKADQWQNIRISGDVNGVTLHVDGVMKERLSAYRKISGLPNNLSFQQTLFFPLTQLGDAKNGYKGQIKNMQAQTFDSNKIKKEFQKTKVTLPTGNYYIKLGNKFLTSTASRGQAPTFQSQAATAQTQLFKIMIDPSSGRHKIVSANDANRYINELGVFGTNDYLASWNTYTIYQQGKNFAIQNGGDAGASFWTIRDNRFVKGEDTYTPNNYMVEIIPEHMLGIHQATSTPLAVTQTPDYLLLKGGAVPSLILIGINGAVVREVQHTDTIGTTGLPKGAYLLKVTDTHNREQITKVVL